jgi:PKD repeat protein
VVAPPCSVTANYIWHADSINTKKIIFTNTTVSTSTTASVVWSFGDGTTATTWNAVHEYAQPGRYNVCLRVEAGPNCISYKCDSITIANPLPPCNNQSNFVLLRAATNSQTITGTPDFQSTAAVYTWTFGDGTGSHDMIATHHYTQAGTYTVCLTVWRSSSCASTTCKTITILPQINCDSIHVTYSYQNDPFITNKVYFYANANFPILDETWTITKISPATSVPVILHQNNPIYVFNDTGYYRVCLKAITLGGCVKEYCSVIRIEHVVNTVCELQAYPNPANSVINVNVALTAPGPIDTYVYNTLNVLVKEKHQTGIAGSNTVTVAIGDLLPGLYTIKVNYGGKSCYARFNKL